jgi:RNA polymerase sigma-70 factor, ECF subfamily
MRDDVDGERQVLELWRAGERERALRLLVDLYGSYLLTFATRICRDAEAAKDVRQRVFLEVWRGLDRFDQRSTLRVWLCAITRNRCIDHLRAMQRHHLVDGAFDEDVLPDRAVSPEQGVTSDQTMLNRALQRCLDRVPLETREAVLMRFYLGLTFVEISDIVKKKPGALQMDVFRALAKLRRCLGGKLP